MRAHPGELRDGRGPGTKHCRKDGVPWGGFGLLWTSRGGLVDFYISRTDRIVIVERKSGRPLLITPERPEQFVAALEAHAG
jgi:hypothetical protein